MEVMSEAEWRAFLAHGTRTAKLATVRKDGRPHVAAVWFDVDGGHLCFMTGKSTVKGRNLLRDPRVMLVVDDERPPYDFVSIEASAEVHELPPVELMPWSVRIARRYMGAAQAEAFGRRNAVPGELLVRVPLDTVTARKGVADW